MRRLLVLALAATVTWTAPAAADEPAYELAGGCYALPDVGGGPFRFQATDLGRYLLYGPGGDFLAADLTMAPAAGPDAEWAVASAGDGTFSFQPVAGAAARTFRVEAAEGCAVFPEVELNVSGPHLRGETPTGEVRGFADLHLHMTAFEFLGGMAHCGRPWHPYGVERALVDCDDHTLTGGAGAVLENVLSGDPLASHDTVGWPTFRDWPAPRSLTHEQTYYRWVERAWRGGLRLVVNLLVENRVLCEIYPLNRNPCDEMASIRLQAERLRELERYIDAQHGGPGRGWFRIVDDPFEARRVINEGNLAVVLGVEISELFGCGSFVGEPRCTAEDIDRQLDEVHAMGVRQLVLIHKFDNAFGGVAGDGGERGLVINGGNFLATGRFWDFETCADPAAAATGVHDNGQVALGEHLDVLDGVLGAFHGPLALPAYPAPPHCNRLGLSALGAHALHGMVDRGMLVDVDHMGVRTRQEALTLLEERGHPGVVSSHSWSTPDAYPRIYALGGMTAPYAGDSTSFVEQWRERRAVADERFFFGLGYGADSNGLGAQGDPRGADAENPVTYPFEGLGGVVIDRQVSGERVYDVNVDGAAHYGLYPDWIEDLRRLAGDAIVEDLARGAEAYLQTWERSLGGPAPDLAAPTGEEPGGEALARTGGSVPLFAVGVLVVALVARRVRERVAP